MHKALRATGVRPLALGMTAYTVLLLIAVVVLNAIEHPPLVLTVLLALIPPCAAVAGVLGQRREIRSWEGVERAVLTEATSLAFYVTAFAALTYGFLEAWAGAPRLSMFIVYIVAMGAWGLISFPMYRRYR
jgi:hypothetical protein